MSDEFFAIPAAGEPASVARMGAKAHNLARMASLGLPVPPAFVIGTKYCAACLDAGGLVPEVSQRLPALMAALENGTALRFGDERRPLLVSVRSGAPASMPGMMQTLLNIGLTERTLAGFLRTSGNPRLVHDAYRRLIAQYGETVEGIDPQVFDGAQEAIAAGRDERALDFAELRAIAQRFLAAYREASGTPFPQDARDQLERAIDAVFRSWRAPHAIAYRAANGIAEVPGTAVIVQAMVFGNAGGRSGAGVGFSRDPATGDPQLCVDFLVNAQGEDVVSGRRIARGPAQLAAAMPAIWTSLVEAARRLEAEFADMQDIEFTVQDGRLFLLQTRAGKRSAVAALRIMLDLHDEGIIDRAALRERASEIDVEHLSVTRIAGEEGQTATPIAIGASASVGVAVGEIALDEARARERAAAGAAIILVRRDAETADLPALQLAQGVLTARGARTSHAAVVARSLGRVCVVGCEGLAIDTASRSVRFGETTFREGDVIAVDGNTGRVYDGPVRTLEERPAALLDRLARALAGRVAAEPAEVQVAG
ncbi:MAG: PEP/pyruvate-binding domain-containing protein [Burkholderiales bacterium]